MNSQHKVGKSASIISACTLFSRILGFIRDMVLASLFGTSWLADAFFVAFRIPNFLRRLFGEGALSGAFIPIFSDYLTNKSREESEELASASLTLLLFALVLTTILGIAFAPIIVKVIAPGFSGQDKLPLTILLTRYMFPYILLIGLAALMMALLNSLKHFAIPAFSPAILNIAIITSALIISPRLEQPVIGIAIGVIIGGIGQLLAQATMVHLKGFRLRFTINPHHPGVKRISKLMLPAIFGLAVDQINVLVATMLASLESIAGTGAISALYYGNRVVQFPLGVFGIAIATASLPTIAAHAARQDIDGVRTTLTYALRLTFFICLPASIGIFILAKPIIILLFERGAFGAYSTAITTSTLIYFSLGIFAYAGVKIITPVYYTFSDTRRPVIIGVVAVVSNIILNVALMFPLKVAGLALGTSLSSIISFSLLLYFLRTHLQRVEATAIIKSFFITLIVSAVMGLVCYATLTLSRRYLSPSIKEYTNVLLPIITSIASYFFFAWILHLQELKYFLNIFSKSKE